MNKDEALAWLVARRKRPGEPIHISSDQLEEVIAALSCARKGREEAHKALKTAIQCLAAENKAGHIICPKTYTDELSEALKTFAALSPCACGGRKVLAEEEGHVYLRGSRAYAEIDSPMIRLKTSVGLGHSQRLRIIVLEEKPDES